MRLIDEIVSMLLSNDTSKHLLQMSKKKYDELMIDYVDEFGEDLEEMGLEPTKHSLEEYLNIKILIARDGGKDSVRLLEKNK